MKRLCLDCGALVDHSEGSWCAACRARRAQAKTRQTNAEMGGSGGRWQGLRKLVYKRQEGRCAACQNELNDSYEVDHVVPRHRGGRTVPQNLQALCKVPCHRAKTAADSAKARAS